MIQLAFLA